MKYKEFGGYFLVANPHLSKTYPSVVHRSTTSIAPSLRPEAHCIKAFCNMEDKNFHELLFEVGQKKLRHVRHILIYLNADLILLERNDTGSHELLNKVETPAKLIPYRLIKNISHHIASIALILTSMFERDLSRIDGTKRLYKLRQSLRTLQHDFPDSMGEYNAVINRTLSIIEEVLPERSYERIQDLFQIYNKDMGFELERYGRQAADYQLLGLDVIISKWLVDYPIDLRSTYIIIAGSRGPREGLIEMQYFNRLRKWHGISSENTRSAGIIYSEMLPHQQKNLDYRALIHDLAGALHNRAVAQSVLNDPNAMNRDILACHAEKILTKLELSKGRTSHAVSSFWEPKEKERPMKGCPHHR